MNAKIIAVNIDNKTGLIKKKDKTIKTNKIPTVIIFLEYSSSIDKGDCPNL